MNRPRLNSTQKALLRSLTLCVGADYHHVDRFRGAIETDKAIRALDRLEARGFVRGLSTNNAYWRLTLAGRALAKEIDNAETN